jgi:hypothetical protein
VSTTRSGETARSHPKQASDYEMTLREAARLEKKANKAIAIARWVVTKTA